MNEIKDELKLIRESQIRMEGDLKYHIKRTDTLENMHENLYKRVFELEKPVPFSTIAKVSASVIGIISGVVITFLKILGK